MAKNGRTYTITTAATRTTSKEQRQQFLLIHSITNINVIYVLDSFKGNVACTDPVFGVRVSVKTVMVSDTKHKIQKKTKRKTNSAASRTKPTWNNSNKHMCT